jgi:excisionase family DNA binding protein
MASIAPTLGMGGNSRRDQSEPRYLTVPEAAALLRVSAWTVRDWARRGRIPATRLGATWLFPRDGLETQLRAHTQQPKARPSGTEAAAVPRNPPARLTGRAAEVYAECFGERDVGRQAPAPKQGRQRAAS